jgi:hypothetical protein
MNEQEESNEFQEWQSTHGCLCIGREALIRYSTTGRLSADEPPVMRFLMARNEFTDDILPLVFHAGVALAVVLFVVFNLVIKVRRMKNTVEQPAMAQKQDGNPRGESPPGDFPRNRFSQPNNPTPMPTPAPAPVVPVVPAVPVLKPGVRETQPHGGAFANNDYRDYREDGALLTGFEVGFGKVFNTVIIAYLRPIWLTSNGEIFGTAYGKSQTPTITVKAKAGYAVGGIVIAGGGALEGFALTFMRIGGKHLDKSDAYTSDWYGEPTRRPRPEQMAAGDGSFVIGLHGKQFNDKGGNNFDDGGSIATIGFYLWVKG